MIVYRVVAFGSQAIALIGYGAKFFGGRWSDKGHAVIYTSGDAVTAMEETRYASSGLGLSKGDLLPRVVIPIDIPSNVAVERINVNHLPKGWNDDLTWRKFTVEIGTSWVVSKRTCVLGVPSVVRPDKFNYLINPEHEDFARIKVKDGIELAGDIGHEWFLELEQGEALSSLDQSNLFDVFICHASEDKDEVVTPLIKSFYKAGIKYWYDAEMIKWGDSVTDKVNDGLKKCRYVIVVLSKNFLRKSWPRKEMNAALNIEATLGKVKVLPLLCGDEEERELIKSELALQNDKLYIPWSGDPELITFALLDRLSSA
jgi:RES domain-containing protein